jgi:hypothetical protein
VFREGVWLLSGRATFSAARGALRTTATWRIQPANLATRTALRDGLRAAWAAPACSQCGAEGPHCGTAEQFTCRVCETVMGDPQGHAYKVEFTVHPMRGMFMSRFESCVALLEAHGATWTADHVLDARRLAIGHYVTVDTDRARWRIFRTA